MKRFVAALAVAGVIVMALTGVAIAQEVKVEPGVLPITTFPPPENCGCHNELQAQFKQSMHAQALVDPAYQFKLKQAEEATGGKLGPFCNKCHAPAAFMAGEFEPGATVSAAGKNGVYCSFCHQVSGTTEPPANVSQLVTPGPFVAQLTDPQCPHPAASSKFTETAEFCGACHDVKHPVNGMHLESAYKEWKEGPYAKEGVVCQNCHMGLGGPKSAPYAGQACATGPERNNIFAMTFPGGNVGQGNAELATKQLQAAAEVTIDVPQVAAPSTPATAVVTVTNVGAGHYIPTGLTEVRQMWLEISATTPEGQTEIIKEHRYGTILKDAKGNAPVELWEAVAIESDDRIPPKGSSVETVTIELPSAEASVTLTAELKYKSLPDDLAKGAGVPNPTTVMASAKTQIFGSAEAARAGAAAPAPTPNESKAPNPVVWMALAVAAVVAVGAGIWVAVGKKKA